MTWWVWEMETIVALETASEEGCNKGALLGLKRAWPPSMSCGHYRTESEEDSGAAAGEEDNIVGAAKGEVVGGWDKESIAEGRRGVLVYLGLWYQVENNRMI